MVNRSYSYLKKIQSMLLILGTIILCNSTVGFSSEQNKLRSINTRYLGDNIVNLTLEFDKPLTDAPKDFVMNAATGSTLVIIDFPQVVNLARKAQNIDVAYLDSYDIIQNQSRTRMIIKLKKPTPYRIQRNGNQVLIKLNPLQHIAKNLTDEQIIFKRIDFKRVVGNAGNIIIHLSNDAANVDVQSILNDIVLRFKKSRLPRYLQQKMDVTDFATPVTSIESRQVDGDVVVTIHATSEYRYLTYQVDHQFIVDVKPITKEQKVNASSVQSYSGKRISLNFQDIKMRSVLQLLADFTGINIVVSDSVEGNITLRLNNVPWDQALDIILRTRGLDKRQMGNVLLVGSTVELATQEQQELQSKRQVSELEPLHSELFQINYAKAADIATLLKTQGSSLLSTRGSVSVDTRTNAMWIQDTSAKLIEIQRIIQKLDIPIKQVLIEARVVNVERGFDRELGIRFGISNPEHRIAGSLDAANKLAAGTAPTDLLSSRLNFDLPQALEGATTSGRIALALAKLKSGFLLDLELSAMESENRGEIISNPRLMTANQQSAVIEAGEEIPYQEATSSGATSIAFKKAVLSLKVTPQITPDNKVVLKLDVTQDKANSRVVLGVPALDTRHIETQVLVENGQTVVLGGIFEQTKKNSVTRVPFFGELPVIGNLFSNKSKANNEKELLIFVTPKIVNQNLTEGF